ncbi:MAG: hypothetical protein LBI27_03925, partial [Clostridiales bacterium]|nr:hypothetical protein [Clostridiales bacterium]
MFLLNSFSITEIRDLITQSYTLAETYRSLSPAHTLTSLGVAFVCGMMIYFVYRFFHRGVVFSESYNILLVLVTISTSFIINTISVNIVLSLG